MRDYLDIDSIRELPDVSFCCERPDAALRSRFMEIIGGIGVSNVFNPSHYESGNVRVFAFRAIPDGFRELVSFVSVENRFGRTLSRISPDLYPDIDAPRLIDPKVFTVGDEVYLTLNSGWVPSGKNDIFVMKIHPTMGEPKRMIYRARRHQERNWSFFSERGEVYAIYQIAPLVILKLEKDSGDAWWFADYYRQARSCVPHDLTLGTQPSRHGNRYYFMAHRKYLLRRKKVYLGRLCALDLGKAALTLGNSWVAHSPESLLGSEVKQNTNLFSCTYFSGLQASGAGIKLGYGINDVDFGFSTYRLGELLR
jgi:hypothetical protein